MHTSLNESETFLAPKTYHFPFSIPVSFQAQQKGLHLPRLQEYKSLMKI